MKLNLKKLKPIAIVVLTLLVLLSIVAYFQFVKGNVKKETAIYIPSNSTYQEVKEILEPHLNDISSFDFIAKRRSYPELVKGGKYLLKDGESNFEIVNKLRSGDQVEEKVQLRSFWSIYDMAGKVSKTLEMDSLSLIKAIEKQAKNSNFEEADQAKIFFLPETYNYFWNVSPEKFVERNMKMYNEFWTADRKAKAKAQNLTTLQATVLASIVQRETIKSDEQPIVAGLYLNRYKKGMKLQADPTLVYLKQKKNNYDATIKRVYNVDKEPNSPYNTYKYVGLPPLPICMPFRGAIDAVLTPKQHDFIFMCAQPGLTGYHNFAISYAEHLKNAKLYTNWADKEGVK